MNSTDSPRLQIRQLSNSGELIKCINCFAGQLSVLRAHADPDLLPYQRALSGRPGPERFSILLNHEPFSPEAHILVGFGERFPAQQSVEQLCISAGIPVDSLQSLLLSYGLEGFLEKTCAELTECASRRLQLLTATYSEAKVMILNNPFEPIASQWRERFAELILSDTRNQQRITVITSLTYRPQCWIGNELVARIQVGETVQKTVGFATQSNDVNSMVNQLRDLLKSEDAVQQFLRSQGRAAGSTANPAGAPTTKQEQSPQTPQKSESNPEPQMTSGKVSLPEWEESAEGGNRPYVSSSLTAAPAPRPKAGLSSAALLMAGTTIVIIAGLTFWWGRSSEQTTLASVKSGVPHIRSSNPTADLNLKIDDRIHSKKEERKEIKLKPDLEKPLAGRNIKVKAETSSELTAQEPKLGHADAELPTPVVSKTEPLALARANLVLDQYPPDIKQAVLKAFSSQDSNAQGTFIRSASSEKPANQPNKERDFFRSLESLSNTAGKDSSVAAGTFVQPGIPQVPIDQSYNMQETMEERQQRIRQKFMEAINRAIEKREQEGEE